MKMRHLLALTGALAVLGSGIALAGGPPIARTYSASDCQDLAAQLDDSMRLSNLPGSTAASIAQQRANGEQACNAGQFAAGARQLRDALDQVIATRGG